MERASSRTIHYALFAAFMYCLYLGIVVGRTIDETISGASRDSFTSPNNEDTDGRTLINTELDMVLTQEQYYNLYGKQNVLNSKRAKTFKRIKRKAINDPINRWTNKEIPYKISESHFTVEEWNEISLAIKEWEVNTCITFRNATKYDLNFIYFHDGMKCLSNIGMIGGQQNIMLGEGCKNKAVILHEIGHAVGFFHEQNRPDRDEYVIIKEENIIDDEMSNFHKYSSLEISTYGVPYDYTSIMHYGRSPFSKNRRDTIITTNPHFQNVIGEQTELSFLDIKLANLMYDCSENCRSTVRCPREGFMDKDCNCWCPGNPIKRCDDFGSTLIPTVIPTTEYIPTAIPTTEYTPTAIPTNDYTPTAIPTNEYTPTAISTTEYTPTARPTNEYTPTAITTNEYTPTAITTNEYTPTAITTNEYTPTAIPTNEYIPRTTPNLEDTCVWNAGRLEGIDICVYVCMNCPNLRFVKYCFVPYFVSSRCPDECSRCIEHKQTQLTT